MATENKQQLPLPILLFFVFCALIGESVILSGKLLIRFGRFLIKIRTRGSRESFGLRQRAYMLLEWGFPAIIFFRWIFYTARRYTPRLAILRLAVFLLISFLLIHLFTRSVAWMVDIGRDLPNPTKLTTQDRDMTTEILDRNGKLLYRLYEQKNRTLISLEDLPPHVIQATIAIEDQHFYRHFGIDPFGIARAAWTNIRTGQLTGGSTITQQLIKNTLLTAEKTWRRKIREIILAFWTERMYSKDEILQMYLNEVAYGGPAWGIEAAALTYFDKHAEDLTLGEAALIAGLPAAPTTYSPFGPTQERVKQRQHAVLQRMVEDGYITQEQADHAAKEELQFAPQVADIKAPHFVMYVRKLLSEKYGNQLVSPGGMRVTTTLDLDLQTDIEAIIRAELEKLKPLNVSNAGAMVTDAQTGEILAMVGSVDYFQKDSGNYNITTALRQPGSSIKPITYALALQEGFTPATIILDTPVRFPLLNQPDYRPVNYDNTFHGPVTLREALGNSFNIPAVKMLATLGVDRMIDQAEKMGITTFTDRNRFGLSLTLGGGEVTMMDMMKMYGTLASLGKKTTLSPILRIEDAHQKTIESFSVIQTRVIPAEVAYILTDILSDNNARKVAFGPYSPLNIDGFVVAVKTGTSDNKRDNWTFGYTPRYVVGVWVGNNDNTPMHPRLTSGITGAAPIWREIMLLLLKDTQPESFEKPPGVEEITYKYNTPCPGNSCRGGKELFIRGTTVRGMVKAKKIKKEDGTEEYIYVDGFTTGHAAQSLPR